MWKGTNTRAKEVYKKIGMEGGFEAARKHFCGLLEDRDEMGILQVQSWEIIESPGGSTIMLEELCAIGLASSRTEQEC